jgi:hypothetical protein
LFAVLLAVVVYSGPLPAQDRAPPPLPARRDGPTPPASDLVRVTRDLPGDSKPILLDADEITTWTEKGKRVLLLRGQVLVQQGVLQARFQQGIVWIDQERRHRTGLWHVDLYGEGDVQVDNSSSLQKGPRALLDLNTRGEIKFRVHKSALLQQARSDDPLVGRARSVLPTPPAPASAVVAPPPAPIQRTSYQEPAPSRSPTGSPFLPAQGAPGPTPAPPPPSPSGSGPAAAPGAGAVMPPLQTPGPTPLPPPARVEPRPPQAAADGPPKQFTVAPRNGTGFDFKAEPLPNGEQAIIITSPVLLTVRNVRGIGVLDMEADRLVIWTKGASLQDLAENLRGPEGQSGRDLEFYLAGNVELRSREGNQERILKADEMYYDASRNAAVALSATLQFSLPNVIEPVFVRSDELQQLGVGQYRVIRAEVFSSKLPSDPGLKVYVAQATIEDKAIPKRSLFGPVRDRVTGEPLTERQTLVHGENVFLKLEDVPVLYFPFVQGDARHPLGPVEGVNFGYNRIFGAQLGVSLDVWNLLGLQPLPDSRWRLNLDYLTNRGPGMGSDFDYAGKDPFGVPGHYTGMVRTYGIFDTGTDILGGGRGETDNHPEWRGRVLWRQNVFDLPYGFTVQSQLAALSDHNFLEQYYKTEFDTDLNQETFLYVKQQQDNWAWTGLVEPHIRNWVTETEWLPRADGYLLGQSFFNRLTYNAHVSAGYAELIPAKTATEPLAGPPPPGPVPPPGPQTDVRINTGRFDLWQELSMPLALGPLKVVPYGVVDLTQYTEDLTGDSRGRFYGGGGVRASIPFTRLYPDVSSDLLNLKGINHKIVLTGNYYVAHSDTSFSQLPQLDRLDDDATDQARRDVGPEQPFINPRHGLALQTSPLYNLQTYAIRRLLDNRVETLDSINVLEVDLRQRLQTKRGYPGMEHIVDWMTLDLSASVFPQPSQNFGSSFAFLQYDWVWNVGDRTALVSSGWFDPFDAGPGVEGARVWTVGAFLNRPDRTNFFLGYRQIDPVQSKAVTGAVTYVFSPKYAVTASSTYDFGTSQALSNSLVLTRMGTDLQVSFGITYNALQNTLGVLFEVLPNLVPPNRRGSGLLSPLGQGGFLR